MDIYLATAALLTIFIGLAHSYLGERYILIRLFRRQDLPRLFGSDWFTRRTLRFAWHLTTVSWWGFAAVLWVLARDLGPGQRDQILTIVEATFLTMACAALVGSRGRHLSWVVFLAVGVLTLLAHHN